MGVLGDGLAALFPQAALKREMYKQARVEMDRYARVERERNYDAGNNGRLNSGWRSTINQSGTAIDLGGRDIVRARARDLERNSDAMGSILNAMERNVVKDGINMQAKTDNQELNEQIEELWKEWCRPRGCDVSGDMSFTQMLANMVRRKMVDGGCLLIKTYSGTVVPFQIQMMEVDELDEMQVAPRFAGNTLVSGVEINRYRKAAGYWTKDYMPDGTQAMSSRFIKAQNVIFYKHKVRSSQVREMSPMANMLTRIRDIDSYMEAVSVKERIAACLAIFVNRPTPTGGHGRGGNRITDKQSGYRGKSITPGMIEELEPGETIQTVTPPSQGESAREYVSLVQRMAGAGIGLSYEVTSRDMSRGNYSSARQALIEDWGTYDMEQEKLVSHVLEEVYSEFVISAVLAGKLVIPDFWDKKKEYLRHTWIMPGRKWIDPKKEADANRIALETNQQTLAQIVGAQGRDWREHIDEIAEIQEYAQQKGVMQVNEK